MLLQTSNKWLSSIEKSVRLMLEAIVRRVKKVLRSFTWLERFSFSLAVLLHFDRFSSIKGRRLFATAVTCKVAAGGSN